MLGIPLIELYVGVNSLRFGGIHLSNTLYKCLIVVIISQLRDDNPYKITLMTRMAYKNNKINTTKKLSYNLDYYSCLKQNNRTTMTKLPKIQTEVFT